MRRIRFEAGKEPKGGDSGSIIWYFDANLREWFPFGLYWGITYYGKDRSCPLHSAIPLLGVTCRLSVVKPQPRRIG